MLLAPAVRNPWRASLPAWRSRVVLGFLLAALALLAGRAAYLQTMKDDFLQAQGEARYRRTVELAASRGRITDRNGELLAVSTPVRAIWASPGLVEATPEVFDKLARLLDLTPHQLRTKLADVERNRVYLSRSVSIDAADRIMAMRVPGIGQDNAWRRFYPGGEVMAHLLGFTDVNDVGQEGIELAYQRDLAGTPGRRGFLQDRHGANVEDLGVLRPAQPGRDVALSIDSRIQSLAFRTLRDAVEHHRAKGGGILVIDSRTGEVLALANLPTYNPNNRAGMIPAQVRNRAVTDMFEPGSTLKPFTVALALDRGKVTPATLVNTAPGTMTIGTATIHDSHAAGVLSVAQIIQKSSNVGAAKIALGMPAEAMWQLFRDVGFGSPLQLGFPGETSGRVRPWKNWRPIDQATMSYGHGIAVSLVQLAHAYLMFARDGEVIPLSLVRQGGAPIPGKQVIAAKTAQDVRAMLELAVSPEGTAPLAQIMGYRVGGKTGTAHKPGPQGAGYAGDRYISSFSGLAPASSPRLIVAVMIDEPHGGAYYGGTVAGPVFATVMGGSLRLLGVPTDAPMKPLKLPGIDQVIEEGV